MPLTWLHSMFCAKQLYDMVLLHASKRTKGFSLLELVTVLAVMGTLAAVAVPVYGVVNANSAQGALIASANGIVDSANARAMSDVLDPARNTNINDIVLATPASAAIEPISSGGVSSGVRVVGQQDLCIDVSLATSDDAVAASRGDVYECATGDSITTPTTLAPPSNSITVPSVTITVPAQLVPVAPTIIGVFAGNLSLTVNFSALASPSRPVSSVRVALTTDESSAVTLDALASTHTFTNLSQGVLYTMSVTSINSAGQSTSSTTAQAVVAPNQVSGVSSVLTGPASATVSWTAVAATPQVPIDGYMVYVTSSSGVTTLVGLTSSTSLDVTGLTPGETYSYSVSAYNSDVQGGVSAGSALVVVTSPPVPVLGLSSLADGSVTITFSVPDASTVSPVSSFVVYVDGTQVATLAATATSYTFTGLTAGNTYDLSVQAVNIAGVSVAATTSQLVYSAPAAPANLVANFSSSSSSSVDLSWSVLPGVSGYAVYMLSSGVYEVSGLVSSAAFTVTNLTPGTNYSFKVAGYSSTVYGALSSAVSATPGVFAPVLVSATAGDESVVLVWSHENRPSITSYSVFSSASSTAVVSGVSTVAQSDGSYSVTVSGLSSGVTYQYHVKALDATRSSAASNSLSFTTTVTVPPAPVIYWAGVNAGQKVASLSVVDGVLVGSSNGTEDTVPDPQVCWVSSPRAVSYQVFVHTPASGGVYELNQLVGRPSSGWGAETCSTPLAFVESTDNAVRVVAVDTGGRASVYSNTREITKGRNALRGEVAAAQAAVAAVAAVAEVPYVAAVAAVYGNRPTYTEDRGSYVSVGSTSWASNIVTLGGETYVVSNEFYTYATPHDDLYWDAAQQRYRCCAPRRWAWHTASSWFDVHHTAQHIVYHPAVMGTTATYQEDRGSWVTTYSNVWSPNVVTLGGEQYLISAYRAAQAYVAPVAYRAYSPYVPAVIGVIRAKINNVYR